MEYLAVVNEKDKVIGKKSRKYVHDHHLIHRGVHIFIVNKKGEVLIQKRSKFKKDRAGYLDASVGGQVLSGETYKAAAIREAKEELGVDIEGIKEVCKYKSFSKRQREIRTLFTACHDGPFRIDRREIEWVRFFSIAEISEMIKDNDYRFTDGFILSFNLFTQKTLKG